MIEKRNRFTVTDRKTVYKNNWIEVVEDSVTNEDNNNELVYGCIYSKPAVCVLPIDKEGNVYLNREFKYALNCESILAAGGFIEDGEKPLEAAKRELQEETGIIAKKWTPVGKIDFFGSISNFNYSLFIAEDLEFGKNDLDENESLEFFKISLVDAYKMVMDNEISYAGAVTLILKAWELKKNLN